MKNFLSYLKLSVLIFALPVLFSCSDDDKNPFFDLSDPSTFPGTYEMVELTDKSGDLSQVPGTVVKSGEPTIVSIPTGPGQTTDATVTITATLVLTATTYTHEFTVRVLVGGIPVVDGTFPDTGTYTISGNQLTTTSDEDGEVEVSAISVSNGQLTFEDDDMKIVYEKQ